MKPLPPMSDADLDRWRVWLAEGPAGALCRMSCGAVLSLIRRLDLAEGRPEPDQQEPTP